MSLGPLRRPLGAVLIVVCAALATPVAASGGTPDRVDFNGQVLPILSDHCFACHGPDEKARKGKLRLDTREGTFGELKGGGNAVVPGKPAESVLIERITTDVPKQLMPPPGKGKPLTAEQIAVLRRWVEQGAPWSSHWAFVAPRRPTVPEIRTPKLEIRSEIDAFIVAKLQAAGLEPSPAADATTLLRRVTLDLTGLPPTTEEIDMFLADGGALAYERAVDRLLRSSRYSEHMARYWLDAARYGDTHGLHLDNYREMWPYRDWVVRAFNANLPFDRFLVEQLAGDLLPDPTLDQMVATGFTRCHVTTNEGGSIEEEVFVRNVADRVDTFGTVMLGLSAGCARCHDHKYDPLTTREYYQLFAYFNSLDGKPMDGNAAQHPPIVRVGRPDQIAALELAQKRVTEAQRRLASLVAGPWLDEPAARERWPGSARDRFSSIDSFDAWLRRPPSGPALPRLVQTAFAAARKNAAQKKLLRDYFVENVYGQAQPILAPVKRQLAVAQAAADSLDKQIPTTLVFKERREPRPAYILTRGEYDQRGAAVGRGIPAFLPAPPEGTPHNRLGLAEWLVAPDHPLTARVAVNRFWQQLFGTGLVKTAEDFGKQGEPPSHPELLDWLAVEFRESGWDVKALMRRLVLSSTYRQSARLTPDRLAKDPGNRLLSRGPRFRLDAETLRDQALAVAGLLVEQRGGPGVKPPQPAGIWEAVGYLSSNTRNFTPDAGPDKVHRRSLYTFWKRTAPPPQMSVTDAPSREACSVRRERTNTPLQALLFLNEPQYVEAARALAERAMKAGSSAAHDRLAFMFRAATGRMPAGPELRELTATLDDLLARYEVDATAARGLIAVGESKADPALRACELAAYTVVANLILNLDEVLSKG